MKNCVLTTAATGANADLTGADAVTFKLTDAKLHDSILSQSETNSNSSVWQSKLPL